MLPHYDFLFVTHLPAFYKINLYNEISKEARVFVIFIAEGSAIRFGDFTAGEIHFDYCVLNKGDFEKRNPWLSIFKLYTQLKKINPARIVVGGWDLWEFWFLILFNRSKAMLALESSLYESKTKGPSGWFKKQFLANIQTVFASGEPHLALLSALGFKGKIQKTTGVGIFNYVNKTAFKSPFQGKFLYVGRLAAEKNLSLLIEVFNALPQFSLTIVGEGPENVVLKAHASANIRLLGYIPNDQLAKIYEEHDIFILPSLKEPWGLVVEEALYYGLPVVVSNRVGCAIDLVQNLQTGIIFEANSAVALKNALLQIAEQYENYADKADFVDFSVRDKTQVRKYLEVLR
jgi:glycosyltransferase involved in cell wall biosynthesis